MKDKKEKGESGAEVLLEYANSIIATLREPFLVLDKKLHVISANQAFFTTFRVTEKETIRRPLPGLGNGQWGIPKLVQLLQEIIPQKIVVKDYEVENKFTDIGQRIMLLNACQLRVPKHVAAVIAAGVLGEGEEEDEELILLAIEDVTDKRRLQDELRDSEERYHRAFETSQNALLLVHKVQGDILNSNEVMRELVGYSDEELSKKKLWDIGVTKNDEDFQEVLLRLEKDGVVHYEDVPINTKKGSVQNVEVFLVDRSKVIQCNIRDITESKKVQDELKEKMQDLERFSKLAVDRELKMEELEKKEVDRELKMEELEKKEKELEEKLKGK